MFDNTLDVTMEGLVLMAKLWSEPYPLCKDVLGIDITHPPEVWAEIER